MSPALERDHTGMGLPSLPLTGHRRRRTLMEGRGMKLPKQYELKG
ncbi:MAG TPA: hypothetical protein VLJ40_02685 [Arthrobacter sp.]|nr:hypothetical protein [Arthrobacter sp.]